MALEFRSVVELVRLLLERAAGGTKVQT